MNEEIVCPVCAKPNEIPKMGSFLVCENCGVPLNINSDGTVTEAYLDE